MPEREWIEQMSQPDLSLVHHALRMLAQHPMATREQQLACDQLADLLWNENVIRGRVDDK